MEKFKKTIKFLPAWDLRETGHGIGAARISFALIGKKGAVTFQLGTGWYLPQNREYTVKNPFITEFIAKPFIYDVGYHSLRPKYKGDLEDKHTRCCFLNGKDCYYESSSYHHQEEVFDMLISEGSSGLWKLLEEEYREYFGEERPRWFRKIFSKLSLKRKKPEEPRH